MNDDVFRPGELCGTYRIVRLLGRGGFADVYQAIDVTSQQKVALKCLQLRHLTNARITQRMVAETELLAGLDHPNVVQVEDAGINGGVLWLAMEYLSGKTLRERLRAARGPLSPLIALYYARQIGEGVAAAHELNVVHRDLKPENIMITSKDQVKVLDLGAAKFFDQSLTLTGEGGAMGTPLYMSPEQIKAEPVDARADVYALGMILYEMLAGRHAFAQPNGELPPAFEIGTLQLHAQPKPLTEVVKRLPVAVWQLVEKAIAKDPAGRFGSMAEFAWAIRVAWQNLSEKAGFDQILELVVSDPGPAASRGQEEVAGASPKAQPALRIVPEPRGEPDPNAEPEPKAEPELKAEPKVLKVEPEPKAAPEPKATPEPTATPEPKEAARKRSGPFFSGAEDDPDEEPRSGVRNIIASSPTAGAAQPPPVKPAPPPPARVVRIGPGGRQGEIVPQAEPAAANGEAVESVQPSAVAAAANSEVVESVQPSAVAAAANGEVVESVQPSAVAAASIVEAPPATAAAPPVKVAQPASFPSAEIASTAAASADVVPLQAIPETPAAPPPDLPSVASKLDDLPAPAPAVVSVWARLRAAARFRATARTAVLIAPMLVVLLALSLRPSELVPSAQSFLLARVPDPALLSAPQPSADTEAAAGATSLPAGDNAIPEAGNAKAPPSDPLRERTPGQTARAGREPAKAARPGADKGSIGPNKAATALTDESNASASVKATQVSARECEKMLFVPSDFRRRCSSARAPAPPAGNGRL